MFIERGIVVNDTHKLLGGWGKNKVLRGRRGAFQMSGGYFKG